MNTRARVNKLNYLPNCCDVYNNNIIDICKQLAIQYFIKLNIYQEKLVRHFVPGTTGTPGELGRVRLGVLRASVQGFSTRLISEDTTSNDVPSSSQIRCHHRHHHNHHHFSHISPSLSIGQESHTILSHFCCSVLCTQRSSMSTN